MRSLVVAALLAVTASSAAADELTTTAAEQPSGPQLAIAVNPPFRWNDAVAGSLYLGFSHHHAIRANVARYEYTGGNGLFGDLFSDGAGDDAVRSGRFVDVGASYTYFPRQLWSGLMLEAGVFVRDTKTSLDDNFNMRGSTEVQSKTYAARGHIGWSWLVYDHVFVSVAVGVARGHEYGTKSTSALSPASGDVMLDTQDVSRATFTGEVFMRIGGAFSL